jgi:hypothetical protein
VIGGRIIGVGSKINRRSIIVYEKAKNYKQFEFIWDPSKDPIVLGASRTQVGTPAGALGGANPGNAPNGAPGNGNVEGQYPGGFNPGPPTAMPTPPGGTQPPP